MYGIGFVCQSHTDNLVGEHFFRYMTHIGTVGIDSVPAYILSFTFRRKIPKISGIFLY